MVDVERVTFTTAAATAPRQPSTAPAPVRCGVMPTCGRRFKRVEDITPQHCLGCLQAFVTHQERCVAEALEALADGASPEVQMRVALALKKIHAIREIDP